MCDRWSTAAGLRQGPGGGQSQQQGRTGEAAEESEKEGRSEDETVEGERNDEGRIKTQRKLEEEGRGGNAKRQSDGRKRTKGKEWRKAGSSNTQEREDKWTVGKSQGWSGEREGRQQHRGMRGSAKACGQEVRWLWWQRRRQQHSRQTPSLPLMLPLRARQPAEAVKVIYLGFHGCSHLLLVVH